VGNADSTAGAIAALPSVYYNLIMPKYAPPTQPSQPSKPDLHDRIQSALEKHESGLQKNSLAEIVETIEPIFPGQVELYTNMRSKMAEAEDDRRARRRVQEVEQELKSFDTHLIEAWDEIVSMGKINIEGLKAMVSGNVSDALMDSAVWPEGFDSLDYNRGSGTGGGFVGSAGQGAFISMTLPLIQERVEALVAALNSWSIANTEAASYLSEVLGEDQPVDLEQ